MASLFSKPKTPEVQPFVAENDARVKAAAAAERDRMKKRKGFLSTILTSPGGVEGDPTTLKTKLGA
jgi:hypothetical protein